jgi:hypothetical protein
MFATLVAASSVLAFLVWQRGPQVKVALGFVPPPEVAPDPQVAAHSAAQVEPASTARAAKKAPTRVADAIVPTRAAAPRVDAKLRTSARKTTPSKLVRTAAPKPTVPRAKVPLKDDPLRELLHLQ